MIDSGTKKGGAMTAVRRIVPIALLVVLPLAGCQSQTGAQTAPPAAVMLASSPAATSPSPIPTPTAPPSQEPVPLRSPTGVQASVVTPTPDATQSTAPAVTPTPDPSQPATPQASAPVVVELRLGASGPQVVALQKRLSELGYFVPAVDGTFQYGTLQAVWALQKAAGLSRDGVVGPATQAALGAGLVPKARTTSGHVVEVDLERQILLAVDNGHVTKVINISSGSGKTYVALGSTLVARTPRGTYAVSWQVNGPYMSTLGLGEMYRPKFFVGGYALHGSADIPPYPASHGCIRMYDAAMDWIWDSWRAPSGTEVTLY